MQPETRRQNAPQPVSVLFSQWRMIIAGISCSSRLGLRLSAGQPCAFPDGIFRSSHALRSASPNCKLDRIGRSGNRLLHASLRKQLTTPPSGGRRRLDVGPYQNAVDVDAILHQLWASRYCSSPKLSAPCIKRVTAVSDRLVFTSQRKQFGYAPVTPLY